MDLHLQITNAINYIELRIDQDIDLREVAKAADMSLSYLQKAFHALCGVTLSEYVRYRRLSLAGEELFTASSKVIDIALKYGYETPESFSRAFSKFHGIAPSEARRCSSKLKQYSRIHLFVIREGGLISSVSLRTEPEKVLTGITKRFDGSPQDEKRSVQEETYLTSTRGLQWFLRGSARDVNVDYFVVERTSDRSYDFSIAFELDDWTRAHLYNRDVLGVRWPERGYFRTIKLPKRYCAVFRTAYTHHPIEIYRNIRKKDVPEWFRNSDYRQTDAPELVALHDISPEVRFMRYIEISIPVEPICSRINC